MFVAGWIFVAIGSLLFLFGGHLILKVSILRTSSGGSQLVGWRTPLKLFPKRRWFMGPVAWNALESNDKERIEKEATALTTESIIFFASSAFFVSLGGIFISLAK